MGRDKSYFAGQAAYELKDSEHVQLRPGLALQLAHVSPAAACKTTFTIRTSPIIFGFILAGENHCRYDEGSFRKTSRVHTSGSNRITYLPDTAGSLECKGGMHRLSIITSQEFLEPYLALEQMHLQKELSRALSGQREAFQWSGRQSTHKMHLVADIFTSSCSGTLRVLHLETRALELIGMQLAEYLDPQGGFGHTSRLTAQDMRKIKDARELLLQDMENPPSIAKLARMAGMNEKKLKHGFKQVFGSPIFEYFRSYRLEMAREMLVSGNMSVTEVGFSIGYQSLGHFSEAFRKRYGVGPKNFQTKQKP